MKAAGWCLLLCGFVAPACSSGQTGSAGCIYPVSCVCGSLSGAYLARATVSEVGKSEITLVVDEVLNPSAQFDERDLQRKIVGPYYSVTQPCGIDAPSYYAGVGASVFVSFAPETYLRLSCAAYSGCESRCSSNTYVDLQLCRDDCARACVPDRSSDTILAAPLVLPWADPLDFGPLGSVSMADAVALTDVITCFDRFPPPPLQCDDDTPPSDAGCGACGLGARGPSPRDGWLLVLLSAAAYAAVRRARKRR